MQVPPEFAFRRAPYASTLALMQEAGIVATDDFALTCDTQKSQGASAECGSGEPIVVGKESAAFVAGDFDADGLLDAVVANYRSGDLVCLRGGPGGPFRAWVCTATGRAPDALVAGDLDADGLPASFPIARFGTYAVAIEKDR